MQLQLSRFNFGNKLWLLFMGWPVLLGTFLLPVYGQYENLHKKFEYKHSFKGPNLAQKDGSVPFWEIHGDAIASSEQIRLAPSIRSKTGIVVNTKPFNQADDWSVELSFKVIGQGRIGADGLAFWYTAAKPTIGNVFGANQYWNGLGVFFDSFDNDARRNNPYVMAMLNDGTKAYDHNSDGLQQELAGCQRDFRNRPFPVKVRIEYVKRVLTLYFHDGMSQQDRFEICFRVENVNLPKFGYFAVSAATGGLADDHDAISFLTHSFRPKEAVPTATGAPPISTEEQAKIDQEFDKYWKEFEQEKEKFRKEHPDKAKQAEPDWSKLYEGEMERELRLIYEGQSNIHQKIEQIKASVDSIVHTQGSHTNMLQRVGVQPAAGGQGQPPPVGGPGIERHEINEMLQNLRDSSNGIRDIKAYVLDIHAKASNIENRQQQGVGVAIPAGGGQATAGVPPPAGGAPESAIVRAQLDQIKSGIEQIRINQRPGVGSSASGVGCQECTGCLSATFFFLGIVVQSALFLLYSMYRSRSEKAKFY